MTTNKWVPSGKNWMMATWVGDTQVIYVAFHDTLLTAKGDWRVVRKIAGSADPSGTQIAVQGDLDKAQWMAEHDAETLAQKGF